MTIFEITFTNQGSLLNPTVISPIYVKANSYYQAIDLFLESCRKQHVESELRPDKISCKKLVDTEEIINL